MNKIIHSAIALLVLASVNAQETKPETDIVTIESNGTDVRGVLFKIFSQVQKNFIVEQGVFGSLYMQLKDIPFEEAIERICKTTGIDYRIEDNVYTFYRPKNTQTKTNRETPTVAPLQTTKKLDPAVLTKPVSVKFEKTDLATVAKFLSEQTGVTIEVAGHVPNFKVDAILTDTSLRFALNSITLAAKLEYALTDWATIQIFNPQKGIQKPTVTSETTTQNQPSKTTCGQCSQTLEKGWKYCPVCGNYIKADHP